MDSLEMKKATGIGFGRIPHRQPLESIREVHCYEED